jgi:hypothetical protein
MALFVRTIILGYSPKEIICRKALNDVLFIPFKTPISLDGYNAAIYRTTWPVGIAV